MAFTFTPETEAAIKKIVARYPEGKQKSALIPVLHVVQGQNAGYLSDDAMQAVAHALAITDVEVYEVATFYTMFNLKPVGRYVLEVCQTGPCMIRGAEHIIEYIKKKLNIREGETTADGMFTLKLVECLGACGYAPMMQIGKHYKEFLTEEKVDEILENLRSAQTDVKA